MANLKTFLRRQAKNLLDSSIQQLRAGITGRLSQKYVPLYGEEKALHLSTVVLNRCLLEDPVGMDGKIFYQNHTKLIEDELMKLSEDTDLAKALSYLYAAEILYGTPGAKRSSSRRSEELAGQAARLGIHIPGIKEICGSADMNECVIEIMKYSAEFYMNSIHETDNTD